MVRSQEHIPSRLSDDTLARLKQQHNHRSAQFVKGPIPMPWLEIAARLKGKALAVALAIRFLEGVTKSPRVRLNSATLKRFNVGRKAGYACLRALEDVGLVRVDRHRGRCPEVRIVEITPRPRSGNSAQR